MAEETGQRVGDYEVLAPLGSGGMGRVYKVRNVISNREEAMKVLHPDFASDPDLAARFMAEIRTLAGLEHPGIAQLRTAFQFQNQFVMVMEFVEGTTLDKMAAQSRIPLDRILDLFTQVLAALSYAHGRGVTHRDIKPANIMITSHGLVKLMDFGIAKSTNDLQLTRPGTTMGSVYYMSPEQVRGGTIDARSDIYSLGVTLYEMLTGRKPFQADTSYSVLNAQLNDPPTPPIEVNPAIPQELNTIVLRAMAKRPEDRFQTAEEFRSALKAMREAETAQIAQPAAPPPAFTPVAYAAPPAASAGSKSHRGLWLTLGAVTAILALAALATLLPRIFATHASQKSTAAATDTQTPATPQVTASPAPQVTAPSDAGQPPSPQSQPAAAASSAPSPVANKSGTPTSNPRPAYKPLPAAASAAQVSSTGSGRADSTSPSAPAGPSPQEIRQAHDRLMNLDARGQSASSGVQQMRTQQQAQGLDMRGDILAAMNRMQNFLNEADRALSQKDLQAANEYMDHADHEISTLEKFLGR
jgi:serine/threonine protein kinase